MNQLNVFISYSHADTTYKDRLDKHLKNLQRNNIISAWHDGKIIPGQEWDETIKSKLENANIILLLVSVDFIASEYCFNVEIKKAIERHDKGAAVVIPIILRACDWKDMPFSHLQALPTEAKPVKSFQDEDVAFLEIVEGIKLAIKTFSEKHLISQDQSEQIKIVHRDILDCDTPPNNTFWIGRKKEIEEMNQDNYKVIFISGFGGQGKSGLASHYVKEEVTKNAKWEFWDWRDCKETDNRIHTKIISIISRLSNNQIKAVQIADETFDNLLELFFRELSDRKIVFVFDNIDAYMEFEEFQLVGAMNKLYNAALKRNHNSKFVFTCRSSLKDIDPNLFSLKLEGLNETETLELFKLYKLNLNEAKITQLSANCFELTKGHPLWLNLIAAQAKRGTDIVEKFITEIKFHTNFNEDSLSSILSDKILKVVWDTLSDKQKNFLRALAETVKDETEDNLSKILGPELNYNQFSRVFKSLKQLNLIVTLASVSEKDTFELHPLVREFIIHNFGRKERSKYISLFVNFYDNIILVLKPKLSHEQPLSFFENWCIKIELAINKDDFKEALTSLQEISTAICHAGYHEEYIRIANLLFITIDWSTAINEEYSYFHSQFSYFTSTLTNFGKFNEVNAFLIKYQKLIINKGINYIRYCSSKSHFHWFQSQYEEAIKWAEEGLSLEAQSNTKSHLNIEDELALALRDTKEEKNINRALEIFLLDNTLENILYGGQDLQLGGEKYGNIGRCLQFLGRIDEAIICYKKSTKILLNMMNKGYGYFWIAECLVTKGDMTSALRFYKNAFIIWKLTSPIKVLDVEKKINALLEINPSLSFIQKESDKEIDRFCKNWTDGKVLSKSIP